MNKAIFIIIGLVVAVTLLFYAAKDNSSFPANQSVSSQSAKNGNLLESKINEEGSVKVKLTPIDVSRNARVWKFNIVLDAHSGELNYDLTKAVLLFDEQGKEYKPISWEGPGPGGHHIEGNLMFNPINPLPKKVEVRILNVGGIDLRSFVWELK